MERELGEKYGSFEAENDGECIPSRFSCCVFHICNFGFVMKQLTNKNTKS